MKNCSPLPEFVSLTLPSPSRGGCFLSLEHSFCELSLRLTSDIECGMSGKPEWVLRRAKQLRRASTLPERMLWSRLKHRDISGLVFRRQHPLLDMYVVDFICLEAKVAVEVDGAYTHIETGLQDLERQSAIEAEGFIVFRFTASDVMNRCDEIADGIIETCRSKIDGARGD